MKQCLVCVVVECRQLRSSLSTPRLQRSTSTGRGSSAGGPTGPRSAPAHRHYQQQRATNSQQQQCVGGRAGKTSITDRPRPHTATTTTSNSASAQPDTYVGNARRLSAPAAQSGETGQPSAATTSAVSRSSTHTTLHHATHVNSTHDENTSSSSSSSQLDHVMKLCQLTSESLLNRLTATTGQLTVRSPIHRLSKYVNVLG